MNRFILTFNNKLKILTLLFYFGFLIFSSCKSKTSDEQNRASRSNKEKSDDAGKDEKEVKKEDEEKQNESEQSNDSEKNEQIIENSINSSNKSLNEIKNGSNSEISQILSGQRDSGVDDNSLDTEKAFDEDESNDIDTPTDDNVCDDVDPVLAKTIRVRSEKSKIYLGRNRTNACLPTIRTNIIGPNELESQYKYGTFKEEYKKDFEYIEKRAKAQMTRNLQTIPGLINVTAGGINKGIAPETYKVKLHDIRKIQSTSHYKWNGLTPTKKMRKVFTRAVQAYNKSCGKPEPYRQIAVVNILRKRAPGEKWFASLLKRIISGNEARRKNDYRKATVSINEGAQTSSPLLRSEVSDVHDLNDNFDNEEDLDTEHRLVPEPNMQRGCISSDNTKLELVKVYMVRGSKYGANSFPLIDGMQITDKNTFFGYNTEIQDINGKKRQKNHPLYIKPITTFHFIGPLNAIREEDYKLDKFSKSKERLARDHVHKYSAKNIVFASIDHYDIYNKEFEGYTLPDCDSCTTKESEFAVFWRLIIGGYVVGAIRAVPDNIYYETKDWGAPKFKWYNPAVMLRKIFRGLSKFANKQELGFDIYP